MIATTTTTAAAAAILARPAVQTIDGNAASPADANTISNGTSGSRYRADT